MNVVLVPDLISWILAVAAADVAPLVTEFVGSSLIIQAASPLSAIQLEDAWWVILLLCAHFHLQEMSENEQILLEGALLFCEGGYYSQNIDVDRLS